MGWLRTVATMETRPFAAGLDTIDRQVQGFDKRLRGIKSTLGTAFAVGGLTSFARSIAQMGSEISDLSTQTGVGARNLQGLIAAVQDAGGRQENLLPVLSKLRTAMGRVSRGEAAELRKAFDVLGISADSLAGLSVDQALERVAQGFVGAGQSVSAFSAVTQLLGEDQGPKLIEVLNRLGKEGLDQVTASAERTGRVMSEEVLETLDKAADKVQELKRRLKVGGAEFTLGATGLLEELAGNVALAVQSIGSGKDPLSYIEDVKRTEAETLRIESERADAATRRVSALAQEKARVDSINAAEAQRAENAKALEDSLARFQKGWNKLFGLDREASPFNPFGGVSLANRADELTRVGGVAGVRMDGGQRQLEIQTQVLRNIEAHEREQAAQGRGQRTVRIVGG